MKRKLSYMLIALVSVVGLLFYSNTYAQQNPVNNYMNNWLKNTPEGQAVVQKANEIVQQNQQQENGNTDKNTTDNNGINAKEKCLYGVGKGCFDYERMVFPSSNLDNVNEHKTVLTVLQDVVLGATFMVGTVLMIVIIYCGLMYILAAGSGKDPNKYKDYLINAAIGALFVWGGYAIVRLIQYIAKG